MLKFLTLCGLFTLSQSKEEISLDVMLVDYEAMDANECTQSTSAAPSSTAYPHGWEKWSKSDADQSPSAASEASPGSVKGNEISGGDSSADQSQQNKVFCKCLAEEKKNGKSYADSQNAFSLCIDKSDGNTASHWKKVSSRYAHKYGVKVAPNPNNGKSSDSVDKTDNSEATADAPSELSDVQAPSEAKPEEAMMVAAPSAESHSFGNTAVLVTFIGASVLLLVCGWFIKGSIKNWKYGNKYERIKLNNNAVHSYQQSDDKDTNKNHNGWHQYSAV